MSGPPEEGPPSPAASTGDASPLVAVVASGHWGHVVSAARSLEQRFGGDCRLVFLVSARQEFLHADLRVRARETIVLPHSLPALLRDAVRLRRRRFAATAVLLTGERSHRRLKLVACLLGPPSLLVVDENGDIFPFRLPQVYRHLRRRVVASGLRLLKISGSMVKLWRAEGAAAVTSRVAERLHYRSSGRTLQSLRLRLDDLLSSRVELATSDSPAVSVVIPAHNAWRFTRHCLRSIQRRPPAVPFEVILVDDASTDRTRGAASRVRGLRVVRNAQNRGFVSSCNRGAEAARGRWVVFLNNDIETTDGWLDALVRVFERHPSCGAVGAKLIYPRGLLQEAGGIIWRDGTAWNFGRGDRGDRPEYNYARRVDYCSGAALMVERSQFLELGGFDLRFAPGYWEDADLCFALRARGRSVWFQPQAELVHFEGVSAGVSTDHGMKRYQDVNARKFSDKWQRELTRQVVFEPGNLFVARDRNRGLRVLVFDHYVPTFDRDAGSAFMDRFLGVLAASGYRVILWPDNQFRSPRYSERLQERGVEVRYGPQSFGSYLADSGRFLDIAVAYRAPIAVRYLSETRRVVPVNAYIAVDLEPTREEGRVRVEGAGEEALRELWEREKRVVGLADCVGVHNLDEGRLIQERLGCRRVVHLPLPVSPRSSLGVPGFGERRDLGFMGSTHPPNVDGLRFLVAEVLPMVRELVGPVGLRVAGDVCNVVPELGREEGVELLGFVDDLEGFLAGCRVFVAPLRYGAGVKGKILEAMNHGVPAVTTPIGAEATGIEAGRQAVVESDPAALARGVARLYADEEYWKAMQAAAFRLIEESYSPTGFERSVARFMGELEALHGQRRPTVSG